MKRFFVLIAVLAAGFVLQQGIRAQLTEEPKPVTKEELLAMLPASPSYDVRKADIAILEKEKQAEDTFVEARASAREECDANLRRANRDTKTETLIECFRKDVQLELSWLRSLQQKLRSLSSTDPAKQLRSTSDNLLQALAAITEGIDTGVFVEEADALDSKQRLETQYRIPFWKARIDLQRQMLLWNIRGAAEELTEEDQPVLTCLAGAANSLLTQIDDVDEGQKQILTASQTIDTCLTAPKAESGSSSSL